MKASNCTIHAIGMRNTRSAEIKVHESPYIRVVEVGTTRMPGGYFWETIHFYNMEDVDAFISKLKETAIKTFEKKD